MTDNQAIGIQGDGKSPDVPKLANFKNPLPALTFRATTGDPIVVDMTLLREATDRLGGFNVGDVVSISSHRNGKGQFVVDYDSVRIERKAEE